jgi:tRNA (guanine37-N1)-methyltransferase
MKMATISVFPEMFQASQYGVVGRAVEKGKVALNHYGLRDFTDDKHQTIDDRPFGGGPGMLLKPEPLTKAIDAAKAALGEGVTTVYVSPDGKPFSQNLAERALGFEKLLFIAGRYEGIDERVIESQVDEVWSLGDYVLSGGELAVMVMMDAIVRLIPGVLGHKDSSKQDSFSAGLLDHPHYTRPESFAGKTVPSVLLSGDHAAIERWRLKQALGRTWQRRPDLLKGLALSDEAKSLLDTYIVECDADPK